MRSSSKTKAEFAAFFSLSVRNYGDGCRLRFRSTERFQKCTILKTEYDMNFYMPLDRALTCHLCATCSGSNCH